jgi:two-component system response regulator FixJ
LIGVIDDDGAVGDSVATLLKSQGYAVATFGSAQAFLDSGQLGRYGCLLVDVRMPGMTGLALLEELKGRGSALPVVMMTGFGEVATAVKAMKAGAVDFVEKPIEVDAILETIDRALALGRLAPGAAYSRAEVAERIERLTPREREVFGRLTLGRPNKIIAHELGISVRTVEVHRANVMTKMRARSLSDLVRMALAAGLPAATGGADPGPGS